MWAVGEIFWGQVGICAESMELLLGLMILARASARKRLAGNSALHTWFPVCDRDDAVEIHSPVTCGRNAHTWKLLGFLGSISS